jgi:hypothetical protein
MLQRHPGEQSRNALRLIKKDSHQRPRVVPIEDYSHLVRDNVRLNIERIYVEDGKLADGRSVVDVVRKVMSGDGSG